MPSYFLWIMLIGMLLMMWFVSRRQRTMQEEQRRRTEKGLVPGSWVRTIGGFYGTVVEVDGDVVTLATPLGDETLWSKRAIAAIEEPPSARPVPTRTVRATSSRPTTRPWSRSRTRPTRGPDNARPGSLPWRLRLSPEPTAPARWSARTPTSTPHSPLHRATRPSTPPPQEGTTCPASSESAQGAAS